MENEKLSGNLVLDYFVVGFFVIVDPYGKENGIVPKSPNNIDFI